MAETLASRPTPSWAADALVTDAQTKMTYAEALTTPPSHADPRLAAREGIRARQIMLEGIDPESKIGLMNGTQAKVELNKLMRGLGLEGKGIRSAVIQKNKMLLIEMEDEQGRAWASEKKNRASFCAEIGPGVTIKARQHAIIVFNTPITLEPDSQAHCLEICEANHMDAGKIALARWVKPPARRTPNQKAAHLFVSFADASTANRVIADGLKIFNKRLRAEKVRKDPIRCLKCQGWNHRAIKCDSLVDKCGNCTEEHRTSQCPQPHRRKCVSCNTDDHASWDRKCPTYDKRVRECDSRNPENSLQSFPTSEAWSWTPKTEPKTSEPRIEAREEKRRQHDVYWPSYERRPLADAVDWARRPMPDWDEEAPQARSWDEDTPHDEDRLIHRNGTALRHPRGDTAARGNNNHA